jgi:putative flippase GtrA
MNPSTTPVSGLASRGLPGEFLRYVAVGGVAFLFDFTTLTVLREAAGFHYLLSAALGFCVGLVVNYTLSTKWVFSRRRLASKTAEFSIFTVVGVAGLALNEIVMWLFTSGFHFHYMLSKLVSAGLVLLWNFSARKILIFK